MIKILNNETIDGIADEQKNIKEIITEIDISISRLKLAKDILIQHQLIIDELIK